MERSQSEVGRQVISEVIGWWTQRCLSAGEEVCMLYRKGQTACSDSSYSNNIDLIQLLTKVTKVLSKVEILYRQAK